MQEDAAENSMVDRDVLVPTSLEDGGTTTTTDSSTTTNGAANLLLQDLVQGHSLLMSLSTDKADAAQEEFIVNHLYILMTRGRSHFLAGLSQVPPPFLVGQGRFVYPKADDEEQTTQEDIGEQKAKEYLRKLIKKAASSGHESPRLRQTLAAFKDRLAAATEASDGPIVPRSIDYLFAASSKNEDNQDDPASIMASDQESGNRNWLSLVAHAVQHDTKDRVSVAIDLLAKASENMENDSDAQPAHCPHFFFQDISGYPVSVWRPVKEDENNMHMLLSYAILFVFEAYLAKQIHRPAKAHDRNSSLPRKNLEVAVPGYEPVAEGTESVDPTPSDVLFGRGGMTNHHPGNRRFRDLLVLHKPDYMRAVKSEKPLVSRRIVASLRRATPPARFLKKGGDKKWYDVIDKKWYEVGDAVAAEKTSQGLRERTNKEKRRRSAMREALKFQPADEEEAGYDDNGNPSAATVAASDNWNAVPSAAVMPPLALGEEMLPPAKRSKVSEGLLSPAPDGITLGNSLPPNAVDKDGNILVTDHDILCGRGGLTNHHKGNKRFRDIVALHRPDYVRAPKMQKPAVARVIVRAIRNGDPPGRFLKKDESTGCWYDIGDKQAAMKTSQALREKVATESESRDPSASSAHISTGSLTRNAADSSTGVRDSVGLPETATKVQEEEVSTKNAGKTPATPVEI